jgi:hypothetical protein
MSLQGSLRTMPMLDLLSWIDRRFACGSLEVERGPETRSFHFDSGYITSAGSNDPTEHLGQMLMNRGLVGEAQLSEAFRVQADTGVRLGKILLMVGAVSEEGLRATIQEKIRETTYDALSWDEGTFAFEPDPFTVVSEYEVSVNLGEALAHGTERADAWRAIRALIPSDDAILCVCDRAVLERADGGPELGALLDGVSQGMTIRQLILQMRSLRFPIMSRLAALIHDGGLGLEQRRRRREPTGEMGTGDLEQAIRSRCDGGDRAGAFELAQRGLEANPESEPLKTLYHELERTMLAELSRDLLTRFRVPKLLIAVEELGHLDMNDAERYLVGRVDGRWDLLSLMNISPLRDLEVLLTFRRLADRGIISL